MIREVGGQGYGQDRDGTWGRMTCQTSVPTGLETPMFRACGKPITQSVSVGVKVCNYCDEHAAAARRFVEQQGNAAISATQHRMRAT